MTILTCAVPADFFPVMRRHGAVVRLRVWRWRVEMECSPVTSVCDGCVTAVARFRVVSRARAAHVVMPRGAGSGSVRAVGGKVRLQG